jgi:lipopolysaccharide biosynthesis glycosyltransferase
VLYLDGDLIALESVRPLWNTELGDNYLAAVSNVFQHDHVHRVAELELPEGQAYFNSGVLLMNLELMRREGSTAALVEWAHGHWDKLAWPEQDALNVVLGHRRLGLEPRWNCMNSILLFPAAVDVFGAAAVEAARADPAIRHFEGPSVNKPWHYLCERGMRELYFEHRHQTPWPDYRLEGATLRNRLRRLFRSGAGPATA